MSRPTDSRPTDSRTSGARTAESQTADSSDDVREQLRALPGVGSVLARADVQPLIERHGIGSVTRAVRAVIQRQRGAIQTGTLAAGTDLSVDAPSVKTELNALAASSLRRVINATGVIVHTNLGRAPLAPDAAAAVAEDSVSYVSLEYDVENGARGSRHDHARPLLAELCGAEDAAVVNNGAAAVLLALSALAEGQEVIVSRGELVEIGGGFRIPDVMRQSGARLVEVGTTNRTRLADYQQAIGDDTALLMKVHQSNFEIVGFTEEATVGDLGALGRSRNVPLLVDAGSGCLVPFEDAPGEIPVDKIIRAGADVVTFSGDKLLGGPQAGILVGRREFIEKVRAHPLMRALRPDKMCIAALTATLRLWRDHPEEVPVYAMVHQRLEYLDAAAHELCSRIATRHPQHAVEVVRSDARIGGGSSPLTLLESRAVALPTPNPDLVAARLRSFTPSVVARIDAGRVLLDMRTLLGDDRDHLEAAVQHALDVDGDDDG